MYVVSFLTNENHRKEPFFRAFHKVTPLIWTFAPKHIHAGVQTIQIENYFAVCIFNEGFGTILNIMKIMKMSIGPESHGFVVRRDEAVIERSEFRASKERKTVLLAERNSLNIQFEVEGPMYGAGIAD